MFIKKLLQVIPGITDDVTKETGEHRQLGHYSQEFIAPSQAA